MPGPSVTIVESGGLAVTAVEIGAPEFEAVDSGGIAITLVDSGGLPMIVSGGTPTPPFAFPEDEMPLGMGLGVVGSARGYFPFANIVPNAGPWQKTAGSTDWKQEWGVVSPADPLSPLQATDTFRAIIAELVYDTLPAGEYIVVNPDGCEIGIGAFSDRSLAAYTTATQFPFTYANDRMIAIHAKGAVTNNNGPIQIIMPGRLSAFQAGDWWNPEFLAWQAAAGSSILRPMDWVQSYKDLTETWAEVPTDIPMMWHSPTTRLEIKVPHQLIVDLCNRLGKHLWFNPPPRADSTFIDGIATYLRDHLDPSLYTFPEGPNEVWNTYGPFNDCTSWMRLLDATRYEAVPNFGISGWTRAAHGLTTGDRIAQYFTKENFTKASNVDANYPFGFGITLYAEVIDANNFVLREGSVSGTIIAPPTGTVKLIYKRRDEPGKIANFDINYANFALDYWQRFDAILGANRTIKVMGTQAANATLTSNRLAVTGAAAATDAIAIAPYYSGEWFVGAVDIASGQLTPKAWSKSAGTSVRIAVYAAGSTPRKDEVLAGAGAGYVGHRDIAITVSLRGVYTTGTAITGLSNTNYEVFSVLTDIHGKTWMAHATVTVSATPSTVAMDDGDEAMFARIRYAMTNDLPGYIAAQNTASGNLDILCYETGLDLFVDPPTPTEVRTLRKRFANSAEGGEALDYFYRYLATFDNVRAANQYVDYGGGASGDGVFAIAQSPTDTSDPRFVAWADFGGVVPKGAPPSVAPILADGLLVEPASFPALVHSFVDTSLEYSIYSGDDEGNFAIVGDELFMVSDHGVDWGTPSSVSLEIEARGQYGSDYPLVSFPLGFSWYAADAQFVWDSVADTDPAAVNPIIGGNLALTGTAATVSGDLWDLEAAGRYSSTTALTATISGDNPFLFATVLDKDNHTAFGTVMRLGGTTFADVFVQSSIPRIRVYNNVTTIEVVVPFVSPAVTGKHVYWLYYDADPVTPKIHVGVDQVENGTGTAFSYAGRTIARTVVVGSDGGTNFSRMKHGTIEVLGRAGLTLSEALDYVAALQTHNGI